MLFNIGLFPLIMIGLTLVFFSASFHHKLLGFIGYKQKDASNAFCFSPRMKKAIYPLLTAYVVLQLLLPFRHWLYPDWVLWSEEGYRFSWRVMLVEKNGLATFHVKDAGKQTEIENRRYLTHFQEKQMSIQPDFMLQFVHFLKREHIEKYGYENPTVTVDAFVALNGRTSQRFIDPKVDLSSLEDGFLS